MMSLTMPLFQIDLDLNKNKRKNMRVPMKKRMKIRQKNKWTKIRLTKKHFKKCTKKIHMIEVKLRDIMIKKRNYKINNKLIRNSMMSQMKIRKINKKNNTSTIRIQFKDKNKVFKVYRKK